MNKSVNIIVILAILGLAFYSAVYAGSETITTISAVNELSEEVTAITDSQAAYEAFLQSPEYVKFIIDNLWILLAAAMVFIMHLGFATVESGFTQRKNSINVIYKNVFILSTGILMYGL
ncbi:MAG: ammonium transporter, partial [Balneolaceae bacterium]